MNSPLPSNDFLVQYSDAIPWKDIETHKQKFNAVLKKLKSDDTSNELPLDVFSEALGVPVTMVYDAANSKTGNVIVAELNGRKHVLGSFVSNRYRDGKTLPRSVDTYNFNPSVNHTNLHQTDDPTTKMRSLGAEIELGLVHEDGTPPSEAEVQNYMERYKVHARSKGITPQVDREAGQYQIETHVSPVVGYEKTRQSLAGILHNLAMVSTETGLRAAVLPAYPVDSDFKLTQVPKVRTATELMQEVNNYFPEYYDRLKATQKRYHVEPANDVYVQMFRNQGCHIHLDVAGRSEALAMFAFYTMLRSASAAANAAVLKGSPFVNGTLDPELLCTREKLRSVTVTGRYIDLPTSPHLTPNGLERYASLLYAERVNSPVRAMLYNDDLSKSVSAMHNPIGRIRPDLGNDKRICTVESMGMPACISASRMAAVLCDFEYSHVLIENYFRKYGCDLEPMMADKEFWALLGPLSHETFVGLQDQSDLFCTDAPVTTATGETMSLAEFYERKRAYMHKALFDVDVDISPRDIDDVYVSMQRMLAPLNGRTAQTIEEFIAHPKLKSTGNWGLILRNAFLEAGGNPGDHRPDIVLGIVNRMHDALCARYLSV